MSQTVEDQASTTVNLTINGEEHTVEVEPRLLLSDLLRDKLGLTGTHLGCEHGVCGACTILVDDRPVRSCLMLGIQADGAEIETVEGLTESEDGDELHPLQESFWEEHALQCGFCTPGLLMTGVHFLRENPNPTRDEIREAISGNLCRCTGYQNIVNAVEQAASTLGVAAGQG